MITKQIQDVDCQAWDAFAAQAPCFSLLQSWNWGRFKESMGWTVYRVAVMDGEKIKAGAQLLIKTAPLGLASVAYVPRGPLCDWQDRETTSALLAEIHRLARKHRAVFLKIEPPLVDSAENQALLRKYGFRQSNTLNQPRNTIIVNIEADLNDLLAQFKHKTRQYVRRSEREGITVRVGGKNDLPAYIELMRSTGQREHFAARNPEYYQQEWETLVRDDLCILLMTYYNDQLLAVRTAYRFGAHAAEFHGGSIDSFPNLHPNYLLVWEGIKWAKAHGCKTYDMWGIPDEITPSAEEGEQAPIERTDGLWGVFRFKSGFSKNVVSYIGAYDYVYGPLVYSIMSNPWLNRDHFEKIAVRMDSLRRE